MNLRSARIEPSKSRSRLPDCLACSRRSAAATARFAHRSLRPNVVPISRKDIPPFGKGPGLPVPGRGS